MHQLQAYKCTAIHNRTAFHFAFLEKECNPNILQQYCPHASPPSPYAIPQNHLKVTLHTMEVGVTEVS